MDTQRLPEIEMAIWLNLLLRQGAAILMRSFIREPLCIHRRKLHLGSVR